MDTALIGSIVGAVVGALGGVVGTYLSIRNTTSSEERAFVIKASLVCWIGVSIFLALLLTLPSSYRVYLWILYGILLPLGITAGNRMQIRIKNRQEAEPAAPSKGDHP